MSKRKENVINELYLKVSTLGYSVPPKTIFYGSSKSCPTYINVRQTSLTCLKWCGNKHNLRYTKHLDLLRLKSSKTSININVTKGIGKNLTFYVYSFIYIQPIVLGSLVVYPVDLGTLVHLLVHTERTSAGIPGLLSQTRLSAAVE